MFTKDILFGMNILTLTGFVVMGLSLTLHRRAAAGRPLAIGPYVRGDGVGVPWAICRRGVKVSGNPLASSFIASCLNTRPKASSSSASFGPTLPLANRKQRSAWTAKPLRSISSPICANSQPRWLNSS
jgi:hypothetical protein